jgi:hypothetical protein
MRPHYNTPIIHSHVLSRSGPAPKHAGGRPVSLSIACRGGLSGRADHARAANIPTFCVNQCFVANCSRLRICCGLTLTNFQVWY